MLDHRVRWHEQLADADTLPNPGTAMHLFYEYLLARHPACLDFASHSPYLGMQQGIAEDSKF